MARGKSVDSVLADARQILRVLEANPTFSLGDITREQFVSMITGLEQARDALQDLRTQLTGTVNAVNRRMDELNDRNVRVRSIVKGAFGGDSSEYEQVGGTRKSDRKSPKRKPTTPATA